MKKIGQYSAMHISKLLSQCSSNLVCQDVYIEGEGIKYVNLIEIVIEI